MANDRNVLEGKARDGSGKGPARRLRMQGMIPAVVYGKSLKAPMPISIDPLALRKAVNTKHKYNTLLTLKVGAHDQMVMLKDFQQDPVTKAVLHADFIAVQESEKVKVKVPVVLVGKAIGVAEGGILSVQRREIEVWAIATAIPEAIEADITHLKVAQALHINDIKLPAGVEVKSNVNYTLAVVAIPDKEEVAVVAAAAPGTVAAGAAAPAADAKAGDAKAGDAKAAPAKKEEKKK